MAIDRMPKFTKIHINALGACSLLSGIVIVFILHGEYCAAAGLAGVVGMVATTFAERDESRNHKNNGGE